MKVITTIWAVLVLAPAVGTADESFRCGSWIVSSGSSVSELLQKCGQPASKKVSTADVYNQHGVKTGTSTTEVWRYDRGSMAAPMIVTILDGRIQSMERGE